MLLKGCEEGRPEPDFGSRSVFVMAVMRWFGAGKGVRDGRRLG